MVIDTSALIAARNREPEAERLVSAIARDSIRLVSAASLIEAGAVAQSRSGDAGTHNLDALLAALRLTVVPVTERQVAIARRAFRHYGKGRCHPVGLNFGDLFSYALANDLGEPLLFKGNDFVHTDVAIAPY